MGLFGHKPERVCTNAPREWSQVSIDKWTGNPGVDTLVVVSSLAHGFGHGTGRFIGMVERRLYPEGVLTIPVLIEWRQQRYAVFVYPRADAQAAAHFSGVRSLLRTREQMTAVYYAAGPIHPAPPGQVAEPLGAEHFARSGDRGPAEYALFWPTDDDPTLAGSPALGALDRWFQALEGRSYVFLTLLAKALELAGDGSQAACALPAQPTMIDVTGPGETQLVLHASQCDGLWFAFDTRTSAATRNLLLGHLAAAAELLRIAMDQRHVPVREDERAVAASWRERRNSYLQKESEGAAGLRLGLVAVRGTTRLSAAGATDESRRTASTAEDGEPSEALLAFVRDQLDHAFERVRHALKAAEGGPNLQAFVSTREGGSTRRTVLYLTNEPEAVGFAPQLIADRPGAEFSALVCDGYLRVDGERSDALVVRAQQRGETRCYLLAQRYRNAGEGRLELLGNWLFTGTEPSLWPSALPGDAMPSPRLRSFLDQRLQERLRWFAISSDAEPPEDDEVLLSPHLEHLKDGRTFTNGYMLMGIAAALPLARKALAESPTCDLASLEYDEPTTCDGRPARSIRFWVHERGTPCALLYALPYDAPRKGQPFGPTGPLGLLRTAEPLFPPA